MSRQSPHSRGVRDFSSPQIRVRGTDDLPYHPNRRLRLPNERPPFWTRFRWVFRIILPLAAMGGIGIGVYFGVSELINRNPAAEPDQAAATQTQAEPTDSDPAATGGAAPSGDAQSDAADESTAAAESSSEPAPEEPSSAPVDQPSPDQEQETQADQPTADDGPIVHPARAAPTISADAVTPGQIEGSPLTADRVTAEPVPEGIPRNLADGSDYDPAEPATAFSKLWPVGTTLRLTRLPGATLLSDDEQAEVVGTEVLVVVRGSQDSNTDLQLSPAAFDQVAVYGVERIIALAVEVTAPPP